MPVNLSNQSISINITKDVRELSKLYNILDITYQKMVGNLLSF